MIIKLGRSYMYPKEWLELEHFPLISIHNRSFVALSLKFFRIPAWKSLHSVWQVYRFFSEKNTKVTKILAQCSIWQQYSSSEERYKCIYSFKSQNTCWRIRAAKICSTIRMNKIQLRNSFHTMQVQKLAKTWIYLTP